MGSLILEVDDSGFDIIDGQQRIITLAIFLQALSDHFKKEDTISDLIIKNITHNHIDKTAFEKIMKGGFKEKNSLTRSEYRKKYHKKHSESQIYKCYDYFKMQIQDEDSDIDEKKFTKERIDVFFDNLDKIIFGIILLKGHDQQKIFDTLNTNTVSLTQAELIKNHLFKDKEDIWRKSWRDVFEKGDTEKYWQRKIGGRENIDYYLTSIYYINGKNISIIKNNDLLSRYKNDKEINWIELIENNAKKYNENITYDIADNIDIDNLTRLKKIKPIVFFAWYTGYYTLYILYIRQRR